MWAKVRLCSSKHSSDGPSEYSSSTFPLAHVILVTFPASNGEIRESIATNFMGVVKDDWEVPKLDTKSITS